MNNFKFKINVKIEEQEALILAIVISIFVALISYTITKNSIKNVESSIKSLKAEYAKAYPLYLKIKNSKEKKAALFKGNMLIFVQILQNVDALKSKILSSSTISGNRLLIKLGSLNLSQIIEVFKTIQAYRNLSIVGFNLKRNFSNPRLMDLNIIIKKGQ